MEKSLKFRQSKGNNSTINDDAPIKLHVHNLDMVIYIQYTFHELPPIGYLVIAEDEKRDGGRHWKDGRKEGRTDNSKPRLIDYGQTDTFGFLFSTVSWFEVELRR